MIVAVPWQNVRSLLADEPLGGHARAGRCRADRAGGDHGRSSLVRPPDHTLPHAVLVGRLGQWVFCEPRPDAPGGDYSRSSSAPRIGWRPTPERCFAEVRGELESIWPAAREARLLAQSRVIAQPAAVFSVPSGWIACARRNRRRSNLASGWRLDGHRLARHDGRGHPQRISGRGTRRHLV